jgi:general secretion pathway protein G
MLLIKENIRRRVKELLSGLNNNSGVTLIEILIVVAILAIMGGLVIPRLMDLPKKAKVTAAQTDIRTFSTILDLYGSEGDLPSNEEGLQKLIDDGKIKKGKNVLNDPWGNPYEYRSPGEADDSNPYEVWSNGADGKPGGEGFDADIKSWE